METMKTDWELHPTIVAPEGTAGEKLRNENDCARKGKTNWRSMEEGPAAWRRTDELPKVWLTDGPMKDTPSEPKVTAAAAVSTYSRLSTATAKPDKACDGMLTVTSVVEGVVEEKSFCDFTLEVPTNIIKRISTLPAKDRLRTEAAGAAGENVEGTYCNFSPAALNPDTPDARIRFTACGTSTSRGLCISPFISASLEQIETPSALSGGPQVKMLAEGSPEWTYMRGEKEKFAKETTATGQTCGNRERPETTVGLLSRMNGMEGKTRFCPHIFQRPSLTSPASTCSSTSSPRCNAAPSGSIHGGRLAAPPVTNVVSNVSSASPIRARSQSFTDSKLTTVERSGLPVSSSITGSLPDRHSTGHTTPMRLLSPSSLNSRAVRKLFSKSSGIFEANDTTRMHQKAVPLPLSAVFDAADDERARFALMAGASPIHITEDAAALEGSGKSSAKLLRFSGFVQEEPLPEDNAATYSDTTVASNTSSTTRLHLPTGNTTIACPLRSLVADESGRHGTSTVAAPFETSVSLNKNICAGMASSGVPNAMIASSRPPLTDTAASCWNGLAMTKRYKQNAELDDAPETVPEEECCEQQPKRYRNTSEQEDTIGLEHSKSAMSTLPLTVPFEHITQRCTFVGEQYPGRKGSSTKVDERLVENPTRTDTPCRKSEAVLLRNEGFASDYGNSGGSSLKEDASIMSRDCTRHFGDDGFASVLPTLANTLESPSIQQLETTSVLDVFHPHERRSPSREVNGSTTLQASKQVFASDQTDLPSLSSTSNPVCRPAHRFRETLPEHTIDKTSCVPPLVASSAQIPADSCHLQRDSSSAVEKSHEKFEGQGGVLGGRSPIVVDPQQQIVGTVNTTMTRTHCDASTPSFMPILSRTASAQHPPSTATCDVLDGDETSKHNDLPWTGGQQRPACRSGISNAVVDNVRKNKQSSVSGSRPEANAASDRHGLGQAWSTSAGKRSSSTPSTAACRTKKTSLLQGRPVAIRGPGTTNLHNKSVTTLTTPTAARGAPKKPQWSEAEDAMLQKFFEVFHLKWAAISAHLTASFGVPRTGKQCRERWCNHVNPAVKKGGWTPYEDAYILRRQKEMGNRWAAIAKELPGRTENAVKNRFISLSNCRRSKRPGCCNHTAVPQHGTRDVGVATYETSLKKKGGAATTRSRNCAKNRNAKIAPQLPQAYGNSSRTNTDTGGTTERGNYRRDDQVVRFRLQNAVSLEHASVGNSAVDDYLYWESGQEELCVVHDAAPSGSVSLPAVREEEGVVEVVAAAERRNAVESLDGGNSGLLPSFQHQMQQCFPLDASHGTHAPRDHRKTATFTEMSSYESAGGNCLTDCITNHCNKDLIQTNTPSEADAPDAVRALAAEWIANRQQPQRSRIQRTAEDSPVEEKGANVRERQIHELETVDVYSRTVPTSDSSGKQNRRGTKHRTLDLPRLQEIPKMPIVRSLADLQNPRLNNKRRALKNSSIPKVSAEWQETAASVLCTESRIPPNTVVSDTTVTRRVCDSCGGDLRWSKRSSSATVHSKEKAIQQLEGHYQSRKSADGAEPISKNLVEQKTQKQKVQRQLHGVNRRKAPDEQEQPRATPSDVRLLDLQKTCTWSFGAANLDTLDASQLLCARWDLPPPAPASALLQAARHCESLNAECMVRQQNVHREAVGVQHSTDNPIEVGEEEKKQRPLEEAATKAAELLRASAPLPILKLPQLYQASYAQIWQTQQQEQETLFQEIGLEQHCQPQRYSQETCSSLGGAASREDAPSEMVLQRASHFFPITFEKQVSARRCDSIMQQTVENAALCKKQKKQPHSAREPEKQQQNPADSVTSDPEDLLYRNIKERRSLPPQHWKEAQRIENHEGSWCTRQQKKERRLSLQRCKGDYDNAQEPEQLSSCSDTRSDPNYHAEASSLHLNRRSLPGDLDDIAKLGAKEETLKHIDHSSGCTLSADSVAQSYLASTLQCAMPVNAEGGQSGLQSNRQHEYLQRPGPLEKTTVRDALEPSSAANASLNDLRRGAFCARRLSAIQNAERKALTRPALKTLYSDNVTVLDPLTADQRTGEQRHKIGKVDFYLNEVDTSQVNPLDSPNHAELVRAGKGNVVVGSDRDDCPTATVLDYIAGRRSEETPAASPSSSQEGGCLFSFPQTLSRVRPVPPQHQLKHQQQRLEIPLPQSQSQRSAGATSQAFRSLGNSLLSLNPRSWSRYNRQWDASTAGTPCAANEDLQSFASQCNTLTVSGLSAKETDGVPFTDTGTEMQGFSMNISDTARIAPASDPAHGHRPAVSRTTAANRVTAFLQSDGEGSEAVGITLNYGNDEPSAQATATAAPKDDAVIPSLSSDVGNLYAGASASFQQLKATEKTHVLMHQELNQQEDSRTLEQENSAKVANVTHRNALPYNERISSGVVQMMEQIAHISGEPTSPRTTIPYEEGDCTPSTVSRRDTGGLHDAGGEFIAAMPEIGPRHEGDTFTSAQPGQDFKIDLNEALQEERDPLYKSLGGNFQPDSARRVSAHTDPCGQEPEWLLSQADACARRNVSTLHNEQEPGKLCTDDWSTQVEASTPVLNIVASTSTALISDDATNPCSAGSGGASSGYVDGKLHFSVQLHEDQPRLQAQWERQKSHRGVRKPLLGNHFLVSRDAAADVQEQDVFGDQQVAAQKVLGMERDKSAVAPKEFVFEDLDEEPSVPSLESASVLSAAARRLLLELPRVESSQQMQASCFQLQATNATIANSLTSERLLAATRRRETCIALTLLQHELQLDIQSTSSPRTCTPQYETIESKGNSRDLEQSRMERLSEFMITPSE